MLLKNPLAVLLLSFLGSFANAELACKFGYAKARDGNCYAATKPRPQVMQLVIHSK